MFVYHSVCKMEAFSNPSFSSVVLVISPLKALMEDQLQEIAKYGISGTKLHERLFKASRATSWSLLIN